MKTTNIYVVLYKGTECYVGYSNNIKVRWREFRYAYNNPKLPSHNEKLIQHIVKYGWYNFSIEVVEENVPSLGILTRLAYWVDAYKLIGCSMINELPANVKRVARGHIIICDRCDNPINNTVLARHHRTRKCQLKWRGLGEIPFSGWDKVLQSKPTPILKLT